MLHEDQHTSGGDGNASVLTQPPLLPSYRTTDTMQEYSVDVSYLEIYNEAVRDLFNPSATTIGEGGGVGGGGANGGGLRVREDPRRDKVARNVTLMLMLP